MKTTPTTIRLGLIALTGLTPLLAGLPALAEDSADDTSRLPETLVTASRLGEGITGAATTVITAEEIERSPAQTIPEILDRVPGVHISNLFGAVNGGESSIDMRGFGATANSNTLILIDGRRLNDLDMSNVDLGAIPRANIERIEITRGNAGSVLYGDGAVGGVINIITKNAANTPDSARIEGGIGSLGYRDTNAGVTRKIGGTALSLFGSQTTSDGYRDNNKLKQRSVTGEIRQTIERGELYLNAGADDRHLGMPGAVLGSALAAGNRRGTRFPGNYGDKQGVNGTLGGSFDLTPSTELVVDAGIRHKELQWYSPTYYSDTAISTLSFTPRVHNEHTLFGLPGKVTSGVDLYQSYYDSDAQSSPHSEPSSRTHIQQRTIAGYAQETVAVRPDTDVTLGGRLEHMTVSAVQRGSFALPSHDDRDLLYAFHLGVEHRLTQTLAVFGRVGRGLRLPNVDERGGASGSNFALKAQTSRDIEAGLRGKWGRLGWQTSAYLMELNDEIHYDPRLQGWGANTNLDPTRRAGVETSLSYRLSDTVRLKGGFAYTDAEFREGRYKGNEVPLVAHWTGTAGVSWDVWDKYVVVDLDARYTGERRFDNDQANFQPEIDDHTLVDIRVGGDLKPVNWSFTVQNLFDQDYYDYGGADKSVYGSTWAYPMPGRTMIGRLGVAF